MRPLWLGAAASLAMAGLSPSASAQSRNVPEQGRPAFSIDVPKGWSASYDDFGNLTLASADRSAFILISMISGEEAGKDYDAIARTILDSAGADPSTNRLPGSAAGLNGVVYLSTLPTKAGSLSFRETLVRIDEAHIGSVAVIAKMDLAADASANLKATL